MLGSLSNRQTGCFGATTTVIGWFKLTVFCFCSCCSRMRALMKRRQRLLEPQRMRRLRCRHDTAN